LIRRHAGLEATTTSTARLSLTLLGGFQARLGSGPPLRLRARKTQALLAYLALPAGSPPAREAGRAPLGRPITAARPQPCRA